MQIKQLMALSHRVRRHVIKMATNGGCFIGASLSCVDILGRPKRSPFGNPIALVRGEDRGEQIL